MKTKVIFYVCYQTVYTLICIILLLDLLIDGIKPIPTDTIGTVGNFLGVTPTIFRGGIILFGKYLSKFTKI